MKLRGEVNDLRGSESLLAGEDAPSPLDRTSVRILRLQPMPSSLVRKMASARKKWDCVLERSTYP